MGKRSRRQAGKRPRRDPANVLQAEDNNENGRIEDSIKRKAPPPTNESQVPDSVATAASAATLKKPKVNLTKTPKSAVSTSPAPKHDIGLGGTTLPYVDDDFDFEQEEIDARRDKALMSQRNRSGRGSNRNNGSGHGEEVQLWESAKEKCHEIVNGVNSENNNLAELVKLDKKAANASKDGGLPSASDLSKMEQHCRTGVKYAENNSNNIRNLIEQLKILKAVQQAKEGADAAPTTSTSSRTGSSTRNRDAATAALYDFDGADSPVPSPIGGNSRKLGDRGSNRDSMPPKADSVEPQGSTGSNTAGSSSGALGANAAAARTKVSFSKGDKVAFKRKKDEPQQGEAPYDWILGEVVGIIGEGKSRRYKCLDVEPEDNVKPKEYKTFASAMIPIPPENQTHNLAKLESGKMVLGLYPQTTAFYAADVVGTEPDGKTVNLKFHGENDSSTTHQVERRYVLEYRP
ncbi:SAGA-associated factor 29 [Colletotrichum sidae]|uniref:SAGA-associated factor 29 n=1 Tax=Colletotrichum sidae TaxID=1347389 RepID=A0A4R8TJW5_9PEZI|nr:SAGA-associated factor 29 [Colletotrichum sidae]